MTSKGRFLNAPAAAAVAIEANQIDDRTNDYLFSEDLWSCAQNGKHHYSQIDGYFIKKAERRPVGRPPKNRQKQ